MSIMGFFLLWFTNVLTTLLGKDYVTGEFVVDTVEALESVYNIFAWLDVFLPMDFLFGIAGLTALFYGYKFVMGISKYIVSLFKS